MERLLKPRPSRPVEFWLAAAVLLAAVLVFYARVLFTGRYMFPWDFRGFHLPLAAAMFDAMRGHGSMLWDPSTYCGRPLFADPQAQVFYPPTVLTVWISTLAGFGSLARLLEWELALHVAAAGWFTYAMLRRMGLSNPASLAGGAIFELGGFFASQTQHLGALCGAAWIPLLWMAVWELRQGFHGRWFAVLAAAGALSILAGFPAVSSVALVSVVLYAALLMASGGMPLRRAAAIPSALLLALGLSAILLLPAIQLTLLSVARYRSDWFDGWGLPPKDLLTLLWPPPRAEVTDLLYSSLGGLALALVALTHRAARKIVLPVALLTALAGVWMLGNGTILGRVLLALTPAIVRGSFYPHFAMAAFCLGLAALAAIGLDRLNVRLPLQYTIAMLICIDLIAAGANRPMNLTDLAVDRGITRGAIDGSAATLSELRRLTAGTPPARFDTHQGSVVLSTTAPLTQLATANGYNPLVLERLIQARLAFAKGDRWGAYYEVQDPASPMVDALNIGILLTPKPIATEAKGEPRYTLVGTFPGMLAYANRSVLPRAWLVHRVQTAGSEQAAFEQVQRRAFDPATLAVVETNGSRPPGVAAPSSEGGEGVAMLEYSAREVKLAVSAAAPAFLATSEVYYPGWHAYLDSAEAPLYLTNAAFRGVFIPAGKHELVFRFTPVIPYLGGAITAVSLALLLFFCYARRYNE